jgi:hypothetical protein
MKPLLFLTLPVLLTYSLTCFAQQSQNDTEKVLAFTKNYCAAVSTQDVNKTIAAYWQSPDFFVIINGKKYTYNEFTTHVQLDMPTHKSVQLYYDTLHIRKLGANYALVTGPFHEIFIEKDGKERAYNVDVSWVLIWQNSQYRLAYATAIYQPMNKNN